MDFLHSAKILNDYQNRSESQSKHCLHCDPECNRILYKYASVFVEY